MSGGGEKVADHEGLLYWDWKGATFFSFTIVTTIGFGSYAPTYPESRIFLIFYVLVGFASTGVVAQILNDALMSGVAAIWSRMTRSCKPGDAAKGSSHQRWRSLLNPWLDSFHPVGTAAVTFVLLLLIGAAVMVRTESQDDSQAEWTFFESFYFLVQCTTTIGLGDFVPSTLDGRGMMVFVSMVGFGLTGTLFDAIADAVEWVVTTGVWHDSRLLRTTIH